MSAPKTTDKNAGYVSALAKRPQARHVAQALARVRRRSAKQPAREPYSPENQ